MRIIYGLILLMLVQSGNLYGLRDEDFFIKNTGRWDKRVLYLAITNDFYVWVTDEGLMLDQKRVETNSGKQSIKGSSVEFAFGKKYAATGKNPTGAVYHYYSRQYEKKITAPCFRELMLDKPGEPGIRLYFSNGRLRYDLIIPPGYDPADASLRIRGADTIKTDGKELKIKTSLGTIINTDIYAYYNDNDKIINSPCSFEVSGRDLLKFKMGINDNKKGLVIDPLLYSTFLGGSKNEAITAMARDGQYLYVTGSTLSLDFPGTAGSYSDSISGGRDVFISKLRINPDGSSSLIYSTYIGGKNFDIPAGIALDKNGNIIVAGTTNSPDFPVSEAAYNKALSGKNDFFILKLEPDGLGGADLVYSTFLGGTDDDICTGLYIKGSLVYVTGYSLSPDYPVNNMAFNKYANGKEETVVSCLNPESTPDEAIVYSTYFGGDNSDMAKFIAVDEMGKIIIAGNTDSYDLPLSQNALQKKNNGGLDLFSAVFDPSQKGSDGLIYSSYTGGRGDDICNSGYLGGNTILITGSTNSVDYPVTDSLMLPLKTGAFDAFITALDSRDYSDMTFSGCLGGTGDESSNAVCYSGGLIYLAGSTVSFDFPSTEDAFRKFTQGGIDAFASVINPVHTKENPLVYSSYLGGKNNDKVVALLAENMNIYISGETYSDNFPVVPGSFDTTYNGGSDAFITILDPELLLITDIESDTVCTGGTIKVSIAAGKMHDDNVFTAELSNRFGNFGNATIIGQVLSDSAGIYEFEIPVDMQPGNGYRVRLSASSPSMDSKPFGRGITILPSPDVVLEELPGICIYESPLKLTGGAPAGGYYYGKGVTDGVFYPTEAGAGSHTVTYVYTNEFGCPGSAQSVINVYQAPPRPEIFEQSGMLFSTADYGNQWYLDGIKLSGETQNFIKPLGTGEYTVIAADTNGCVSHQSLPYEYSLDFLKPELSLGADTISAYPGMIVKVTLVLKSGAALADHGIQKVKLDLRFNSSLLEPAGNTPKGYIRDGERIIPIELNINSWDEPTKELQFMAMLGNDTATALVMDNIEPDIGNISMKLTNGWFELLGVCRAGGVRLLDSHGKVDLMMVRPNPANRSCRIELETVESGITRLYIMSVTGRIIKKFIEGRIPPGRRSLEADLSDVPSGAYFLILKTPAITRIQKLNIIK